MAEFKITGNVSIVEDDLNFNGAFDSSNLEMFKLQAVVAAVAIVLIVLVQFLRFITFMLVLWYTFKYKAYSTYPAAFETP